MKVRFFLISGFLAVLVPGIASAWCFEEAARYHDVDASLLRAMAKVESRGNARAVHKNENGTEDVCLMQINSSNFDGLARYGITRERLLDDPCTCVQVGAWILSEKIRRYGKTWRAVGAYNAKSENKRLQYVELVEKSLEGERRK